MQWLSYFSPGCPPVRLRQLDVTALCGFVTAAQHDDYGFSFARKIHAVTLTLEYPQLINTRAHGLPVAGQPEPQAIELNEYPLPQLRLTTDISVVTAHN
jgi:hypothetical protein